MIPTLLVLALVVAMIALYKIQSLHNGYQEGDR
jgi:hypothetical protein